MAYSFKNMNSEAIWHYNEALRLKPNLPYAYLNLSKAQLKMGDRENAENNLLKAEQLIEKSSPNCNAIGISWAELGDLDKANKSFYEALLFNPESSETLNNIVMVLIIRNQFDVAKPYIQKAIKIAPDSPQILNNYGLILASENKLIDAICAFSLALKIQPDYEKARANLYSTILKNCRQNSAIF